VPQSFLPNPCSQRPDDAPGLLGFPAAAARGATGDLPAMIAGPLLHGKGWFRVEQRVNFSLAV